MEEGTDGAAVLEEAKHFVEAMVKAQEEGGAGKRVRGPYLARLEFLRQLKEAGLEEAVDLGEGVRRAPLVSYCCVTRESLPSHCRAT